MEPPAARRVEEPARNAQRNGCNRFSRGMESWSASLGRPREVDPWHATCQGACDSSPTSDKEEQMNRYLASAVIVGAISFSRGASAGDYAWLWSNCLANPCTVLPAFSYSTGGPITE